MKNRLTVLIEELEWCSTVIVAVGYVLLTFDLVLMYVVLEVGSLFIPPVRVGILVLLVVIGLVTVGLIVDTGKQGKKLVRLSAEVKSSFHLTDAMDQMDRIQNGTLDWEASNKHVNDLLRKILIASTIKKGNPDA